MSFVSWKSLLSGPSVTVPTAPSTLTSRLGVVLGATLEVFVQETATDTEESKENLEGLTDEEARVSREEHGPNEIRAAQTPEWKKV